MAVNFYEEKDIRLNDCTEEPDNYFYYTFDVGKNENGEIIKVGMQGHVRDAEADSFEIRIKCFDEESYSSIGENDIKGYIDYPTHTEYYELPESIQAYIYEKTKEQVIKDEREKIKEDVEWYTETDDIENVRDGFLCVAIGEFNGNIVYADIHAEIKTEYNEHGGQEYIPLVYNMDNDKAYIVVPNDEFDDNRRVRIAMPSEVLERCLKIATEEACKLKCDELHEKLYAEYKENYDAGWELGADLRLLDDIDEETDPVAHVVMDYEEWLSRAYPDEGYFVGHVLPEEAKFLCEHDKLINLDYYDLYEKTVRACASLEASDFMDIEDNAPYYEVQNPGIFEEQINIWIERSDKPDIIKELCDKYQIEAKDYSEFYSTAAVYVYDYITFEDKGKDVVAHIRLSVDGEDICLNNIPLSGVEQGFVRRAIEEFKDLHPQKEVKHQDDKEH